MPYRFAEGNISNDSFFCEDFTRHLEPKPYTIRRRDEKINSQELRWFSGKKWACSWDTISTQIMFHCCVKNILVLRSCRVRTVGSSSWRKCCSRFSQSSDQMLLIHRVSQTLCSRPNELMSSGQRFPWQQWVQCVESSSENFFKKILFCFRPK